VLGFLNSDRGWYGDLFGREKDKEKLTYAFTRVDSIRY
jgi:hypothetical protein